MTDRSAPRPDDPEVIHPGGGHASERWIRYHSWAQRAAMVRIIRESLDQGDDLDDLDDEDLEPYDR